MFLNDFISLCHLLSHLCSMVSGCIKGAAHSINAILQPTVLYVPVVEVKSTVVSTQCKRLSTGSQILYTATVAQLSAVYNLTQSGKSFYGWTRRETACFSWGWEQTPGPQDQDLQLPCLRRPTQTAEVQWCLN